MFTPAKSFAGGLLLGTSVVGKLALCGRVLGISGIFGGILSGDRSLWRLAFLGGLTAGSLLLRRTEAAAFQVLPPTFSIGRALLAGALVGVGTGVTNGCTSGHGICGNARLSIRSMVATATFMATGVLTATLTRTLSSIGSWEVAAGAAWQAPAALLLACSATGFALLGSFGSGRAAGSRSAAGNGGGSSEPQSSNANQLGSAGRLWTAAELVAEFLSGTVFALGLGISGMLQPGKVAAFLSPLSPQWDPSLLFVMGGALAVALPGTQLLYRRRHRPLVARRNFQLPSSRQSLDARLVGGAAMFGAGWGLGGICPGPGLVTLGAPGAAAVPYAAFVGAMAAGMAAQRRLLP